MRIQRDKNNTIIKGIKDFDLAQTLECGQCFRFYKQGEEDYAIVAKNALLNIKQTGNELIFIDTDMETVKNIWVPYFDLDRDYSEIKSYLLRKDSILRDAIDEKYGVRILNQEFHETLISFIISQNKQIPHIKQIVKTISENYGDFLGEINGERYYSFPDVKTLGKISEKDYRDMKTGFRAPYLYDASQRLCSSEISVNILKELSEEDTRKKFMTDFFQSSPLWDSL